MGELELDRAAGRRRLRILIGLLVPYLSLIVLACVYPESIPLKWITAVVAVLLAVVQIRWLNQEIEETEARISRRVWGHWIETDEKLH